MALFARGTHAKGTCDRCGFAYPLRALRREVVNLIHTNTLVCPDCWDSDHPQLQAGKRPVFDAEALRNARPDPRSPDLTNTRWGWRPVFSTESSVHLGQVIVLVHGQASVSLPAGEMPIDQILAPSPYSPLPVDVDVPS